LAFLLVLGPMVWAAVVMEAPPLAALTHTVVIGRYVVATIILLFALIIAHRVLPNIKLSLWQLAPGIALTLFAWMAFAWLFSYYLGRFALNYVATYAGLASIMIAILFLYSTAVIFIFGGEFNAALRRAHEARPAAETGAAD
jgi:membrane protein